ncbi:hypothetical protein [Deinococcus sp.]|uniref:hypothetical protein n=1 Tax=Deinococcus sp. TaxID=47478 RepID=UPI003B5B4659
MHDTVVQPEPLPDSLADLLSVPLLLEALAEHYLQQAAEERHKLHEQKMWRHTNYSLEWSWVF